MRDWDRLADDLAEAGDGGWTPDRLVDVFAGYHAEHDEIVVTGDARGPALFQLDDAEAGRWRVRQVLLDPEGYREWYLAAHVYLPASAAAGEIRAELDSVHQA
jgi:hypothetical protein